MNSKSQVEEEDPQVFATIEHNFLEFVSEILNDPALENFKNEYEKLNNALIKSHANNKALIDRCQQLNNDISSNAVKIANVLSLSQNDTKTIATLKEEFEKAWEMLEMSEARERKSKDVIDTLKQEINKLQLLVKQVNSPEYREKTYQEAKMAVDLMNKEIMENSLIIKNISEQTDKLKKATIQMKNNISELKSIADENNFEIDKLDSEYASLSSDTDKINNQAETGSNELKKQKEISDNLKLQKNETRKRIKSKKNDLKSDNKTIDFFKETNSECRQRIHKLKIDLEICKKKSKCTKNKCDFAHEQLESCNEKYQNVQKDIKKALVLNENKNTELFNEMDFKDFINTEKEAIIVDHHCLENKICQAKNKITNLDLDIRTCRNELGKSTIESKELVNKTNVEFAETKTKIKEADIAQRNITETRKIIQDQKGIANSINTKVLDHQIKYNGIYNNTNALEDLNLQINDEIDRLSIDIQNTQEAIQRQDTTNDLLEKEKSGIVRLIANVKDDNQKIVSENKSLKLHVKKLKEDLSYHDQEIVALHNKTEGLKEEINKIKEDIDETKIKKDQAEKRIEKISQQIIQQKVILNEARNCITSTNKSMNLLTKENSNLSQKISKKQIEKLALIEKGRISQSEIKMAEKKYIEKKLEIDQLIQNLKEETNKQKLIIPKVEYKKKLQKEISNLQKMILQAHTQNKLLEKELESPRFIHRWIFLAHTNPELFELIQVHCELVDRITKKINSINRIKAKKNEIEKMIKQQAERPYKQILPQVNNNNNETQINHSSDGSTSETLPAKSLNTLIIEEDIAKMKREIRKREAELVSLQNQIYENSPQINYESQKVATALTQLREAKVTAVYPPISKPTRSPRKFPCRYAPSSSSNVSTYSYASDNRSSNNGQSFYTNYAPKTASSKDPSLHRQRQKSPSRFIGGGFAVGIRPVSNSPRINKEYISFPRQKSPITPRPIVVPLNTKKVFYPKKREKSPNTARGIMSARLPLDNF